MTIRNALAGVAVNDLDKAVAWYAKPLRRDADQRTMPEVAEFAFPGGRWLQVFVDSKRAGNSSVTLAVESLDAEMAALKSAGVRTTEPTRSDYVDTVILNDPDGNQILLAEAKSAANKAAS